MKQHSGRSADTQLFRVTGVSLKAVHSVIETHLGSTFVVANHPALQLRGDKSLTVTIVRADGEAEDGYKLTLSVGGKIYNLKHKENIGECNLSSGPVRPDDNGFDSLIISPGPDW